MSIDEVNEKYSSKSFFSGLLEVVSLELV